MRATVIGKARDLSISCENADRRFLGEVSVEGHEFIYEAFGDGSPAERCPAKIEGFVSIYAQRSEALRQLLIVRNLDKPYQQIIDRYADLRSLTTFDREGMKLFMSVMLNATDFNYFAGFIESNFFTELQYVIDLPFYSFPVGAEAQANVAAKYGYILPTKPEFRSGKPCFFPNTGISFGFEHPNPRRSSRSLRTSAAETG